MTLMNLGNAMFTGVENFKVISVEQEKGYINIHIKSQQLDCACFHCGVTTKKVHSYYIRKCRDLSILGQPVVIYLRARKFYCITDDCPTRIFTERFSDHFLPYKRNTERLERKLVGISLETSARSAERISRSLGMPISDTSLLRMIERTPLPPLCNNLIAIGVDDWAFKKRDRYGSILVNLETNQIVDLLKDREASSLSDWLQKHPGIRVITRDRYGHYIQGSTTGAPNAQQVTDRWHLLKNLGEAVRKVLDKEYQVLKRIRTERIKEDIGLQKVAHNEPAAGENSKAAQRQKDKFLEVKRLHAAGETIRAIARKFKMHRETVKRYLELEYLPVRHCFLPSKLDLHLEYIKKRITEEPEILIKCLWQELLDRGYKGAYTTLCDGLRNFGIRTGARSSFIPGKHKIVDNIYWRPSKTCFLFFRNEEKLSTTERRLLSDLCEKSTSLNFLLHMVKSFRQAMTQKSPKQLRDWIERAENSTVSEIAGFAKGLKSDLEANMNAFKMHWSNGPVEGCVNKLKTVKRMMYGRARFGLLRKKLILSST